MRPSLSQQPYRVVVIFRGYKPSWLATTTTTMANSCAILKNLQQFWFTVQKKKKMVRNLFGLVVWMLATVAWCQRSPVRVAMVHEDDVEQIKAIVLGYAGEDTGTDEYKTKVQVETC